MIEVLGEVLIIATVAAVFWFICSAVVWFFREDSKGYSWYKGKITTSYNAIAFIYNVREYLPVIFKKLKPKSKIDRDIERELKKIRKEEKEIESMENLKQLIKKRERLEINKEKLFEEVSGTKEHSGLSREEELFYFRDDGLSRSMSIPVPDRVNAKPPVPKPTILEIKK